MTVETAFNERPVQAIFSVCADEAAVEVANSAAFKVSGAHFAGEFRDYITAEKRPQFSPLLKNAVSCVALIDFERDAELALETTERLHQIFLNKIAIVGMAHNWMRGFYCGQFVMAAPSSSPSLWPSMD